MQPAPFVPPVSTLFDRLALRVVQLGAVFSILVVSPYFAFELDRFYVPKELVLHATAFVSGVLMLARARQQETSRLEALLGLFLVVSLVSALFAQNGWAAARAVALTFSGLLLFGVARGLYAAGLGLHLLRGLAFAVVVAAGVALLQAYGVESQYFSVNRSPGGTLGNRNSVGHIVAFGLPLVLTVAWAAPRRRLWWLVGAALCMAALVLTRSRAAWLGAGVVGMVVAMGLAIIAARQRLLKPLLYGGVLAIVMGAGALAALTLPNALRWRSDAPYAETARGVANYREGSGRGRLVQYRTSFRVLLADPLLGAGPGNWAVAYPGHAGPRDPSLSARQAGRTANPWPSSDVVALASERGLLGAALAGLAWLMVVLGAARSLWRAVTLADAFYALALLALALGVTVVGLFDAVLLLPAPLLLVAAGMGALGASPAPARTFSPRLRLAAWALLLAFTAGATWYSTRQLRAMEHYAEGGRAALEKAAALDPGSYLIHLRLAEGGGGRTLRCRHARAAHALFPHAARARALARRCPAP